MTSLVVLTVGMFTPHEDCLGRGYLHADRAITAFPVPVRVDVWKWWRYTLAASGRRG